jgi:hypothetical protein
MSDERLRQAAQKIREAARLPMEMSDAGEEPWFRVKSPEERVVTTKWDLFADAYPEDAALIALMAAPPVALAVADWLDTAADADDVPLIGPEPDATRVADLILGEPAEGPQR